MQSQLIAELPLPTQVGVTQGLSARQSQVAESGAGKLQANGSHPTETVSIPVTCRIVRLVPDGLCIDFVHLSGRQRQSVNSFLRKVDERTRTVEVNGTEAIAARQMDGTVVPESANKLHSSWIALAKAFNGIWPTAIWERKRIQRSKRATSAAVPQLALDSPAERPGEDWSDSVAAAPPTTIEPDNIRSSEVRAPGTHLRFKWAGLIAVAILALVIGWVLKWAVSGSARIPLGLQVLSRGKQLEIRWNHEATSIRKAAKGVMRISDGGVQEVIKFDASQLRNGAVAYSPTTNDVNVRLEVNGLDGTSSWESVRSVTIR